MARIVVARVHAVDEDHQILRSFDVDHSEKQSVIFEAGVALGKCCAQHRLINTFV